MYEGEGGENRKRSISMSKKWVTRLPRMEEGRGMEQDQKDDREQDRKMKLRGIWKEEHATDKR